MEQYLDRLHAKVKQNKWMGYFTRFTRVALALGFIPSGFVKIMGERFTSLSNNHPMGHYLEALYHTGYYYTCIGVFQVLAAVLLLIPRTATLGAFIYFPIILNICVLSLSVRFDGSLISAPLMVLANLYLLCWDYDKFKKIFPFKPSQKALWTDKRFPVQFASAAAGAVVLLLLLLNSYRIRPMNHMTDCLSQCNGHQACADFCACIHESGNPWPKCLETYEKETSKKKNSQQIGHLSEK